MARQPALLPLLSAFLKPRAPAFWASATLLGLGAFLAAAWDYPIIFDLAPASYVPSVERFAEGARDVEIDPNGAEAGIPAVLPGPADQWAGGVSHALRFRLPERAVRGLRLDLYTRETHESAPPRLSIASGDVTRRIQTRPGTGLPPPHERRGARHRYTARLLGESRTSWLTLTNEAGSWVIWERIRLLATPRIFAWSHLARTGALPSLSAILLLASLGTMLTGALLAARRRSRNDILAAAIAPAVALVAFGVVGRLVDEAALARQPRWLTLSLPWLFLAATAALGSLTDAVDPLSCRVRAWVARALDVGVALLLVHLLLILFTGGYAARVAGITIPGWRIPIPAIALLVLVILRVPVRHGFSWRTVAAHETAILVAALSIVYLANGRSMGFFDTQGARYLPLSILREGNFYLDQFRFLFGEGGPPRNLRVVNGHYLSSYPVGAAILALPFYLPSALGGLNPESPVGDDLEKLSAAVLVALSAGLLYLAARRVTDGVTAVVITLVYALGSSSLSTSSQALWQHTAVQPALAAALYGFVRARTDPPWLFLAGFAVSFAVLSRPANVLLALPLTLYAMLRHRIHAWRFLLGTLPPAAFQLWYDLAYFGDLFHPHLPIGYSPWKLDAWDSPLTEGVAGILVSPGRGLLVYSPVFLFSLLGMALAWRRRGDPLLRSASVGCLLLVLLSGKWRLWHGGPVFGPRLLADLVPLLAFALWPLRPIVGSRPLLRAAFAVALLWSVAAHSIGAFYDDWRWNHCTSYEVLHDRLWSWHDNQLVNPLKRAVVALWRPPTSETHPGLLGAVYSTGAVQPLAVEASQPVRITVRARNVGEAVWRAEGNAAGEVSLQWRWGKEPSGEDRGAGHPGPGGFAWLCADTFPGEVASFHLLAPSPDAPGSYRLELGLVRGPQLERGLVRGPLSFAALGTPPLRLDAAVRAGPLATGSPAPR